MLVAYPALFYYDPNEESANSYFVSFPDIKLSATQGNHQPMPSSWLVTIWE